MPQLFKEVNKKTKFKLRYLLYTLLTFIIGIILVKIESKINITNSNQNFNNLYLIVSGFFMSVGIIVPGVSSTVILMLMNIYDKYIFAISNLYIPILLPIGVGVVIGCIVFMKGMKK